MSYATPADMIDAYGQTEITRLSVPEGGDVSAGVDTERVQARLDEVSDFMDGYLRRRYLVPIVPAAGASPSPVLRTCCCALARYAMSFGGGTEPSEQARLARKEQIGWLDGIGEGRVTLDGAVAAGPNSFAQVQDRAPLVGTGAAMCGPDRDYFGWR